MINFNIGDEPEGGGQKNEASGGAADIEFPQAEINLPVMAGNIYMADMIRPQIVKFEAGLEKLEGISRSLKVANDADQVKCIEIAGISGRMSKTFEKVRDRLTEKESDFVKKVRAIFKPYIDRFEAIKAESKRKNDQYVVLIEMDRRRKEQEAAQEAARLQAELNAQADAANEKAEKERSRIVKMEAARRGVEVSEITLPEMPKIEAPTVVTPIFSGGKKAVRTAAGSAHTRERWVCIVERPDEVPREYCAPSQKLLDEAVGRGVRVIAGCRIEEKMSTILRTG